MSLGRQGLTASHDPDTRECGFGARATGCQVGSWKDRESLCSHCLGQGDDLQHPPFPPTPAPAPLHPHQTSAVAARRNPKMMAARAGAIMTPSLDSPPPSRSEGRLIACYYTGQT